MRGLAIVVIGIVVACGILAVILLLTRQTTSAAVVVPSEFLAKQGVVSSKDVASEGRSLAGRAYDTALFSAEKSVFAPEESWSQSSYLLGGFVVLVMVACVLAWVHSR